MDRLVRADPERTKPIRNVSHHLRHSSLIRRGDTPMADNTTKPQPRTANAIIGDAVSRGYKVIEDQIQQGRDAAERFRAGTYNSGNAEEDIKTLVNRMMDLAKDLGTAGFELAAAAIRDPRAPPRDPHSTPSPSQSPDVAIETHSARRVQVTCKLSPPSARFVPSVPALYSNNPEVPPLKGIRLEVRDSRPVLIVTIQDNQPASTYAGAIVDLETNQAGGFVSVSILP
jgi:hypothetical protein